MLTALIVAASLGQCVGGSCYAPAATPYAIAPGYSYGASAVTYPAYRVYRYSAPTYYYTTPSYGYRVYAPAAPRVLYSTPWGAGSCYGVRCR